MFAIDPRRTDLALEFKRRPFGPHSPELQAVLNVLRGAVHCQNLLLVCTRPHAEWHAFRVRWQAVTGQALPALDRA